MRWANRRHFSTLRRQAAFRSFPNKEAGAGTVHLNILIAQRRNPLKRFPVYKFGALVDLSDSGTLDSRRRSFCETFRWQAFEFSSNKLKAPADGNAHCQCMCSQANAVSFWKALAVQDPLVQLRWTWHQHLQAIAKSTLGSEHWLRQHTFK